MRPVLQFAIVIAGVAILSGCASAHEEVDHFGFAAFSAARDFNVGVQPIPNQMQALQNPYGYGPRPGCEGLWREAQHLGKSLGQRPMKNAQRKLIRGPALGWVI